MIKNRIRILFIITITALFIFSANIIAAQNVSIRLKTASSLIDKEQPSKALSMLNKIEKQCLSSDDKIKQQFYYYKGMALFQTKDYLQAIPNLKKSIRLMEYNHDKSNCQYLGTLHDIACCYKNTGDYENAESYFRKAIIANDIQLYTCERISQTYLEIIGLYKLMNKPALADACLEEYEKHQLRNKSQKEKNNRWSEVVDELYLEIPNLQQVNEQDKSQIKKTFTSILETINSNIGKCNDDYIRSCRLFAIYMLWCKDTTCALDLNLQLINIGEQLSEHKPAIADAYDDFLRLTSRLNKVEVVKSIIPKAIKYNDEISRRDKQSVYEIAGLGFYEAGNTELGVGYLEQALSENHKLSIRALSALADYYYTIDPQKSLDYCYIIVGLFPGHSNVSNETKFGVYNSIMKLNSLLGNYSESIVYGKKAVPFTQDIDILSVHYADLARQYAQLKDYDSVDSLFSLIDDLYEKISDWSKVDCLISKSVTYIFIEKYDLAISTLIKSIEIIPTRTNFRLATIYHNLGRAYMLQSNYEEALGWLYKSRDIQKSINGSVTEKTANYIKECETKL